MPSISSNAEVSFMLPVDRQPGSAQGADGRGPRRRRKGPPQRGGSRTARIIALELSAGLHFALFLAMLGWPPTSTPTTPPVVEASPIPIEVAFAPQPTAPQPRVAPPAPQRKPIPEPLPRAAEQPERLPQRTQAAAPERKPPKPRQRPAEKPAPRNAQPVEPAKPDLQQLLAQRLKEGRRQEEQRAAAAAAASREGSERAPATPANGVPVGDPTTTGSGLSGALRSRAVMRSIYPEYPPVAQRMGEEGEVRVRLYVTPEGQVARVEVVSSSGRDFFDRAAKRAAASWAFAPAAEGTGEQWGDITMYFRLR
jgi:protein TonB